MRRENRFPEASLLFCQEVGEKVDFFILSLFDVFYLLFDGFRCDLAVFSGMFIF